VPFATGIRAHIRVEKVTDETRAANVIGILPGVDPRSLDRRGRRAAITSAASTASCTQAPTTMARHRGRLRLARAPPRPVAPATLVFAFFGAEELA
jgi:hypothetical protein